MTVCEEKAAMLMDEQNMIALVICTVTFTLSNELFAQRKFGAKLKFCKVTKIHAKSIH